MIAFLSGTIFQRNNSSIIVLVHDSVGYEVTMSPRVIAGYTVGTGIRIYTYLKVSENAQDLYGFETPEEKEFFELLMTVSGIGPKSAMNILSLGSREDIQAAISRGDVKYLTGVQGMGKKTAERLVVELKGKITVTSGVQKEKNSDSGGSDMLSDVIEGLMALGYSREESKKMLEDIDTTGKTPEELLKQALTK